LYATSETNPLGVEYQIIPSQTPLLGHEKNPSCVPYYYFASRHKQNTPILDHNTPLKAGVLLMVFVSWYIFIGLMDRRDHRHGMQGNWHPVDSTMQY
jgi:hypothetical protein